MTPLSIAILLFAIGGLLLFAEVFLPSHGILGLMGGLAVFAGLVACFVIGRWIGLSVFVGLLVITPFMWAWAIKIYPKTPIGRRMILQEEMSVVRPPPVHIGQEGVTISRLSPSGEVEFGDERLEVISERGMIEPGARVKVVALESNRPVVRTVSTGL
jgi:membrane-bound serine protease (ClpP class)